MVNGKLLVKKGVGKVEQVSKTLDLKAMPGQIGIGHTRWATHGGLTNKNAHPHEGCSSEISVVHNGIIDNYEELKKGLIAYGHSFKSETDSEVIAHLLEKSYSELHDKVRPSFKFVINYMEHMLLLLFLATGQSVAADMMNHLLLDCQMTDISSQVMCLDFCNTPIKLFF
jgi:glucosamine--fructose-6-phosphate aminotransferase (isomerizing)